MTDQETIWYLPGDDSQPRGPYSTAIVTQWALGGKIEKRTLCWRQGMANWQPLSSTEPFAAVFLRADLATRGSLSRETGGGQTCQQQAASLSPPRTSQEKPPVRHMGQHQDVVQASQLSYASPTSPAHQGSVRIALTSPIPPEERSIWEGRPSLAYHVPRFVWSGLWIVVWIALVMAAPLLFSLFKENFSNSFPDAQPYIDNPHLKSSFLRWFFVLMLCWSLWRLIRRVLLYLNSDYLFTTQRLKIRSGILSRHFLQIELFRVKDIEVLQSLWGRLWNYAHVRIISSDPLLADTTWTAFPDGVRFAEQIRLTAQAARSQTGITTIHE